jgi:hypothetical protein
MSKSPNRNLVRLQGKLKLIEKGKNCLFVSFYYKFKYSDVLGFRRLQWLI